MILFLLLISAPLEKPKCHPIIQLIEIRHQARLVKFRKWLEAQKPKEEKK